MFYLLLVLLVGLLILGKFLDDRWGWRSEIGVGLIVIAMICLLIIAVAWTITYFSVKAFVNAEYLAIAETIKNSRLEEISELERVALTNTILEANSYIASCQYWNTTIFDPFYPDEVMELELLK